MIMVGCSWCTYPSIHLFDCAGTLKIMVGCLMCGVMRVVCFLCVHVACVVRGVVCGVGGIDAH